MGISEICVQLGVTEIQVASKSILEHFVQSSCLRNIDTTHPQYAAMAVYQMCKLKKIKIQKSKLISFSHLKSSQWALLEKSWETWSKNNKDKLTEFQVSKKGQENVSAAESVSVATCKETGSKGESQSSTACVEPYTDWRERTLKKAFEDLENSRK